MGDPKKQRRKYETPSHPWQAVRMERESELQKKYGLRRKYEIWKMDFVLKKMKRQAKELLTRQDEQGQKEKQALLQRAYSLGLVPENAALDNLLDLEIDAVLDRRLQTQLVNQRLARTPLQARQFIVHRQVMVGERKVDSPSYLVKRAEERVITFDPNAKVANPEHPERVLLEKKEKKREVTPMRQGGGRVDKRRMKWGKKRRQGDKR